MSREDRGLECRFCQKQFFKGEHLRRHERSHTGQRPFVCKECKRAFSRQDSLMRHERLHSKQGSKIYAGPSTEQESSPQDEVQPQPNQSLPRQSSIPQFQSNLLSEADFELIWPDSEDLFQSIRSSDNTNQWQLPLGPLPFTPESYAVSHASFEPSTAFEDHSPSIGVIPSGGNHQAINDVRKMVANTSSSLTAEIDTTSITSVFLDECLHMFFVRFVPTFPVLHRATFIFRECSHPLLLNAIAIGSLYLGPKDAVAKGEILWRLAHAAVATSWQSLITHRGPHDSCCGVQLVLTSFLGLVYGSLSKSKAIRTASQTYHAQAFFWSRHAGLFDSEPYDFDNLPAQNASAAEKDRQWRIWVSREIQQRAVLAHYVLDGIISQMLGNPTSVRHTSNQLRLPSSDALFDASSADEWLNQIRAQAISSTTLNTVFKQLFSSAFDLPWLGISFSPFSLRILLEGIQSIISDHSSGSTGVGVPSRAEIQKALGRMYEIITHALISSVERLEILLRWHTICLESITSSSNLCLNICQRCNIDQTVWPPGKTKPFEQDLIGWVDTVDGRKSLLHAVSIQEIVETLPRGRAHPIHMPSSLFSAATIYSVFALAGHTTVRFPANVEWKDVMSDEDQQTGHSDTSRYILEPLGLQSIAVTSRNLLYEFNSMQKLFGCLATQWGISSDMEKVVDKWITLCH